MRAPGKGQGNKIDPAKTDITAALSDTLLQRILLSLSPSARAPCTLVCHRWLKVLGGLRRKLRLRDWAFLESGRLPQRFPSLTDVDLTMACMRSAQRSIPIVLTLPHTVLHLSPLCEEPFSLEACIRGQQLPAEAVERGLEVLASGCPDLQRLCVVDVSNYTFQGGTYSEWKDLWSKDIAASKIKVAKEDSEAGEGNFDEKEGVKKIFSDEIDAGFVRDTKTSLRQETERAEPEEPYKKSVVQGKVRKESGLASVAKGCPLLQELEVHQCTDDTLLAVAACQNVQILRLVGSVPGFCRSTFTDVGLTILAQRCNRLVRLELSGCEASFDGIAAIGRCCLMLEELTLSNSGFQDGWIAALAYCQCLKTLRLERCKFIDRQPGPSEHLKSCPTLERLQLVCCDLRDRVGFIALLSVCMYVKELELQDCWGVDDETFGLTSRCRRLKRLSLEGCSLLTTSGLEVAMTTWKDLERLRVVSCDNVRDADVSPALGDVLMTLKEFRWRPDTKSVLAANLAGTGVGQKGGRFFKKA